jgi:hypothetical protein
VSAVDDKVDRLADRLDRAAETEAPKGGLHAKIAGELADDAAFLRKLKPSLIKARAKGELPTNEKPGSPRIGPSGSLLGPRTKQRKGRGPNPWLVAGVALAAGVLLAKAIDWRGHAHPSD